MQAALRLPTSEGLACERMQQVRAKSPMLLEAKGLRVVRAERVLLRDVDVRVDAGEVLGVLGPSGAGKSTLFRALVGESRADAGTVVFDGRDITAKPLWERARDGIGYVPQTPSVLWDFSVADNLSTFLGLARRTSSTPLETPGGLAARVDLGERMNVRAGKLSGGERRRLELARALAMQPRLLVCDEPFAGVDPKGAERLGTLLRSLADQGVAIVLADHHVEEALAICSRAVLLLDGAVEAEGDPKAFVEHPLVRGRYLGTLMQPTPR